jgi:hypothetical protein
MIESRGVERAKKKSLRALREKKAREMTVNGWWIHRGAGIVQKMGSRDGWMGNRSRGLQNQGLRFVGLAGVALVCRAARGLGCGGNFCDWGKGECW